MSPKPENWDICYFTNERQYTTAYKEICDYFYRKYYYRHDFMPVYTDFIMDTKCRVIFETVSFIYKSVSFRVIRVNKLQKFLEMIASSPL